MPDDTHNLADAMRARGAEPVTIRAALGSERTARHAAYRLPLQDHAQPRIDQLYAIRELDARQYQNACAVMELAHAAGLFRSKGVAEWMRVQMGRSNSLDATPEDELRQLIRDGGTDFQAVLMLIDPQEPPVLPYMWSRALRGLNKLDFVASRWDGERWGQE
jgi:hypothetical protein